ncbi:carcinoembryonic antigen-related cell adhesion molecule 1-like isoform X2 [Salarias fasciatus]|uniref:carcinoembryonic antigen-related cell adhesion molecule 1-like isoform X2 n=1 Tax=Salarias fasciatus TaxID=181472 RepID=UPI0011765B3B|nr:carcinoembryonic antigen-related cell adhesion molecule 1-like isoform X2 [Salarias fasciatus]
MWPRRRRSVAAWPGWLCAALLAAAAAAAVHAQPEVTVYGKLGGEVALHPGVQTSITSIVWKEGADIAVEWDGTEEDRHRHYRERGRLNRTSGVMTITGLVRDDSKVYTPEINNKKGTPVRLTVISPVPVPTVTKQCVDAEASCTLTCSADTTGADPVTYRWKSDLRAVAHPLKDYVIKKNASETVKEFSCELQNPVSLESSQAVANPFAPTGGVKISNGVIVFICLLGAVLLLVAAHRLKAGVWFFEKGSMPWEADFWKKYETAPSEAAAASNGTSASPQQRPSDEETALA